ncbi:hypothetical protein MTO96_007876, partial [Rhipicephalus appendiculatus]
MASFVIQPPDAFNFSSPNECPKWKKRFERFRTSSGLCVKPEQHQVDVLLCIMGEQAEEIYATVALSEENSKKFDAVVEQFDKYFIPRRNVTFERARFNTRVQQDGESAEDFVTALHTLSKDSGFGALREEFVRDRLVVGIKDKQLSARLQLDADLTLQKALDSVHQIETVRQQQAELHQEVPSVNRVASGIQDAQGQTLLPAPPRQQYGPDGKLLLAAGVAQLDLIYRNRATTQDVYVLDQICTPLLGKPAIKKIQMLTFVNAVADKVNHKEEFPTVFQGLGKLLKEHKVQLQPGAKPLALSSPRRMPIPLYEKTKLVLQRMQKLGVISPVDEPTEWCAPMVVVPKPSGD